MDATRAVSDVVEGTVVCLFESLDTITLGLLEQGGKLNKFNTSLQLPQS